jgi:diacylglycerol kinase family enzyme
MSRAAWFVAGAGAGVYAMVKARRTAEALTPEGLADRLAGLSVGARLFGDEVRAGMQEKETELRDRLGLALHGTTTHQLTRGLDRLDQPAESGDPERNRKGND